MSEPSHTTPLVECIKMGRRIGDVTVLSGVDLSLEDAATTVVVGPNGSGKTSLLRLLVGLNAPTTGTVTRRYASASRPVGYLPQDLRFRPTETPREILETYTTLVGGDDTPSELLERVGLAGAADRRVSDLSGGMVRLLGVAQALAGDPPMVVLDEPTSGLDPRMTDHVFEVVETLGTERGVVLTTHDLGIVPDADRLVVLDDGTVAANDTPRRLFEAHGTDDTTELFRRLLGTETVSQTRGGP